MTDPRNDTHPDPTGSDVDHTGSAVGPVDDEQVERGLDDPVLESDDFPGGGGPGGEPGHGPIWLGGRGSTGRNATDEGKADPGGEPGGGMAGSAGG